MKLNPTASHYYLAGLEQNGLLARLRRAADDKDLLLWEMIGLNHIYTPVAAGPLTAQSLQIHQGEIIGYRIPDGGGHFIGAAIGDAMVKDQNPAPPIRDIIGNLRWRSRLAGRHA